MSYAQIAIAATVPGILYFIAVGAMVHFEAVRRGLPVTPRSALPRFWPVLKRDAHLIVAPALLVWFLFVGRSAMFAGFWSLVVAYMLSWVRRDTRVDLRKSLATLMDSAQAAMPVALACATVGIVVGVVSTTGLGLKLATGIVGLAGGSLFMTLILSMVAALVLGTGLPTSATYIMTSIMAAPALELLGVPKLVAHFFVFYFGILADLPPPTRPSLPSHRVNRQSDVWTADAGMICRFPASSSVASLLPRSARDASAAHIAYPRSRDRGVMRRGVSALRARPSLGAGVGRVRLRAFRRLDAATPGPPA